MLFLITRSQVSYKTGSRRKVLLAEDESIIALDISSGLRHLGYNVIKIVSTGKDLIKEAIENDPEVIVSDIHLKDDITGVEAVLEIKNKQNAEIILISGYNDPHTLELIKELEPCVFIRKPTSAKEISAAIEKCFGNTK
jgi:DNA-binding NarL/FixJ family response regulator